MLNYRKLTSVLPKQLIEAVHQLSFILKSKTNEPIGNNFIIFKQKLNKILAKILKKVNKTTEVRLAFTNL